MVGQVLPISGFNVQVCVALCASVPAISRFSLSVEQFVNRGCTAPKRLLGALVFENGSVPKSTCVPGGVANETQGVGGGCAVTDRFSVWLPSVNAGAAATARHATAARAVVQSSLRGMVAPSSY